jgi:hypothetical protein
MIVPIGDVIRWAERYQISMEPIECPVCRFKFKPTIPIAMPNYRGVTIDSHGCGRETPYRVVPVGDEQLKLWENLRPPSHEDSDETK